jgi:hypothetical protein
MSIYCIVCNKSVKNIRSLSAHIRQKHQIKSENYYTTFLQKDQDENKCKICGNDTSFIGLGEGFNITCGHVCGGIYHRKNLNDDILKSNKFKNKVCINMKKEWAIRKDNGQIDVIRKKYIKWSQSHDFRNDERTEIKKIQ